MTETPRIYVADLAAYNAGTLRGIWVDATKEPDEIRVEVEVMLAGSPEPIVEEWGVHDHEGFGQVHLSEWTRFEEVHEIALLIEEHGALGAELLSHWNNDVDEVRRLFDDGCYLGRVIWLTDLGETKAGNPMRGVLVAIEDQTEGQEPSCPAVFVRVFGQEAEHVTKGDWLAAEGNLEAAIKVCDGKPSVNPSIIARWAKLTGHAGQRQRKSEAAKAARDTKSHEQRAQEPGDFFGDIDDWHQR